MIRGEQVVVGREWDLRFSAIVSGDAIRVERSCCKNKAKRMRYWMFCKRMESSSRRRMVGNRKFVP